MRQFSSILSSPTRFLLAGASLIASAAAQDLYVGGPDGIVLRGHPVAGDFQPVGVCGGPIASMVLDGEDLFLGDSTGNIYHYDASANLVSYEFTLATDATGLALLGSELFVSASDGEVLRVDKVSGTVIESVSAPVPVEAVHLVGSMLYVGSSLGVAFRRDVTAGTDFEFFGTCGGPIASLSADATALLLGDTSGALYRIDFATQIVTSTYGIAGDNAAMVYHKGDVLLGSSAGDLRRVGALTGSLYHERSPSSNVQAMALRDTPEPGDSYCYGDFCPCGNDDPDAGCSNSLGSGAWLRATGSPSVATDDLSLFVTHLPPNQFSLMFMAAPWGTGPVGDGVLCIDGSSGFHRFPVQATGPHGFVELDGIAAFGAANFGAGGQIVAGASWEFQLWYRDPSGPCGTQFNTSNGYLVVFQP